MSPWIKDGKFLIIDTKVSSNTLTHFIQTSGMKWVNKVSFIISLLSNLFKCVNRCYSQLLFIYFFIVDQQKLQMNPKYIKLQYIVDSLISGHHRGNDFCPLIGGVRFLESLIFLTFCGLGRGTLKVLSF